MHIQNIVGTNNMLPAIFTAQIKSVDGDKCTIDIDGLQLTDVRLRAVVNGENSKILITPKIDSYVLVADVSGGKLTELVVVQFSEIDKIEIDCETEIIINGGDNAGLVKIKELTDKLNVIENDINNLKAVFSAWLPVVQDGGKSLKMALGTWYGSQLTQTQQSDIENDKIKH